MSSGWNNEYSQYTEEFGSNFSDLNDHSDQAIPPQSSYSSCDEGFAATAKPYASLFSQSGSSMTLDNLRHHHASASTASWGQRESSSSFQANIPTLNDPSLPQPAFPLQPAFPPQTVSPPHHTIGQVNLTALNDPSAPQPTLPPQPVFLPQPTSPPHAQFPPQPASPPQPESDASGSDNAATQHQWVQTGAVTTTRLLSHLVIDEFRHGNKLFFCGVENCAHPSGFPHKSQLITHIRSVHLQEKPFLCVTCRTSFARKQEAIRHVNTANSGRRFECTICGKTFARKNYRDSHTELCLQRRTTPTTPSTSTNPPSGSSLY